MSRSASAQRQNPPSGILSRARAELGRVERRAAADVRTAAREVGRAAHGVGDVFETVLKSPARAVASARMAFNPDRNVERLAPGDSYSMMFSANASAPGGKVLGRFNLDVNRNADGSFTLGVGAEALAGLFSMLGMDGLAGVGLENFLAAGSGARVELTYPNAQETERALHLIKDEATRAAWGAPLFEAPVVLGQALHLPGLSVSKDDERFLAQGLSALELRGTGLEEAKTRLGAALGPAWISPLFTATSGRDDQALRIEFANGQPAALGLKETRTLDGSATASVMAGGRKARFGSRAGESADLKGTYSLERRVKLPDGASFQSLWSAGKKLANVDAHANSGSPSTSWTLQANVQSVAQGPWHGDGTQRTLKAEGQGAPPGDVMERALGLEIGQGHALAQAISHEAPGAQVSYREQPYQVRGMGFSPEARVMGMGVGFEAQGYWRHLG